MTTEKTTRRARLVARFRRLRRVQLVAAALLLFLIVTAFQTTRLDRLTQEAAAEREAAHQALASVELVLDTVGEGAAADATRARVERAREHANALDALCTDRRQRCEAHTRTIGAPARLLGFRCREECE